MLAAGMLGSMSAFSLPNSSEQKENDNPNIVLIVADDLGYGDLNLYGTKHINTPNIDALSKQGVVFSDFHSNGAVCSPTRAALLSGYYQQRVGIDGVVKAKGDRHKGMDPDVITIADELKQHGYYTGMFGKWHLGYDKKFNPINLGFDEFNGFVSGNVDYHSHIDQEGHADWYSQDSLKERKGYTTDLITEDAVGFIRKNAKRPFFLYLPYETPHYPYQDRDSKADRFVGAKPRVDFPIKGSGKNHELTYAKMIEILDEGIGRLVQELEEKGVMDNTIIFFCSDNGAASVGSCGGLRGTKTTVWEGGHRVPAFAVWKGQIPSSSKCNETLLTFDLYPTFLDIIGKKSIKHSNLDGVSFKRSITKNKKIKHRYLIWKHGQKHAIRYGTFKLVVDGKGGKPMLFDLDKDIKEAKDIASENMRWVNKLQKQYSKWEESVAELKH